MTEQPPAVPLPGPNVTPEPNEKIKVLAGVRKTPWHGVTEQRCRPSPRQTSLLNRIGSGKQFHCSKAQRASQKTRIVAPRRDCRPSGRPNVTPEPMKTSRLWQANPLFQAQKASQKTPFKTPWHGVTEQPPAVPLPGPSVTPEPNEKIKDLAGNSTVPGAETKPQHTLQIRNTPWHCVTERPPAVPLPGPNVTPEPNEKIKVLAGNSTVPGAKSKPEDTLRIRKTPWHGVTEQPTAVPLPGPNVNPEPNEKSKVLASNSTVPRHRKRARRHPSNQENTLLLPSLCPGQTSLLN